MDLGYLIQAESVDRIILQYLESLPKPAKHKKSNKLENLNKSNKSEQSPDSVALIRRNNDQNNSQKTVNNPKNSRSNSQQGFQERFKEKERFRGKLNSVVDVLIEAESEESLILGHGNGSLPVRSIRADKNKKSSSDKLTVIKKGSGSDDDLENDLNIKDPVISIAYGRLVKDSLYAHEEQRFFSDSPLDYVRLWGYNSKSSVNNGSIYVDNHSSSLSIGYGGSEEERMGILDEQKAHSIVDRIVKMKMFGNDPSDISPDEMDRYVQWKKFSHNKVLRNLWQQTSGIGYNSNFLPMIDNNIRTT